jgi:hypothetical protein
MRALVVSRVFWGVFSGGFWQIVSLQVRSAVTVQVVGKHNYKNLEESSR